MMDEGNEKMFMEFMVQLQRAKELEEEAKGIKDGVKEQAVPLMLAMEIKTFKMPGIGAMSYVDGTSKTLDQSKLRGELLKLIPATEVARIMDECTKVSKYMTLQFKQEKVASA